MNKLIFFILGFSFLSCQKSEIMEFTSNDNAVYFQMTGSTTGSGGGGGIGVPTYNYVDSMVVSFANFPSKVYTVYVPMRTLGKVKNYSRPVKVVLDENQTNAVEGVDFKVDLAAVNIPANEGSAGIKVQLLRTDNLLTQTKRVAFRLLENEYFKLHIQYYKTSSNWQSNSSDTIDATRFAVVFNAQYTEPTYYKSFGENFWGPWTPKKYQVLNDVMGWTVEDWKKAGDTGAKISLGRMDFAARATQRYLQEMADAGTPVLDTDGSYIQLTEAYAVDYSNYNTKNGNDEKL